MLSNFLGKRRVFTLIVKEVAIPYKVFVLEALIERLESSHPKMPTIQWDLNKTLRGHRGEKEVSYYLDFLPEKEYFIFNGLRLPSGKYFFQMDFLLLTTRFALILECKNFFGNLGNLCIWTLILQRKGCSEL